MGGPLDCLQDRVSPVEYCHGVFEQIVNENADDGIGNSIALAALNLETSNLTGISIF